MFHLRIVRIISFILILFLTDYVLGSILKTLYFQQKIGQTQRLTHSFIDCKAECIILGNSRAQHHYDSRILSKSLGMTCYNAGQDGGHSLLLPYAQLEVMLLRNKPKLVILEFDPESAAFQEDTYAKLAILLPYLSISNKIRPIVELRSKSEKLKLLSHIYPYNSSIVQTLRYITKFDSAKNVNYLGYVPIINKYHKPVPMAQNNEIRAYDADSNILTSLFQIINLCKRNQVKLVIVNSPEYHSDKELKKCFTKPGDDALSIIRSSHTTYWDFTYNKYFINKAELFADRRHLNEVGAKLFSKIISQNISEKLLQEDENQ